VSAAAIEKASRREGGAKVHFVQDDILNTSLKNKFDYIFIVAFSMFLNQMIINITWRVSKNFSSRAASFFSSVLA